MLGFDLLVVLELDLLVALGLLLVDALGLPLVVALGLPLLDALALLLVTLGFRSPLLVAFRLLFFSARVSLPCSVRLPSCSARSFSLNARASSSFFARVLLPTTRVSPCSARARVSRRTLIFQ